MYIIKVCESLDGRVSSVASFSKYPAHLVLTVFAKIYFAAPSSLAASILLDKPVEKFSMAFLCLAATCLLREHSVWLATLNYM